MARKQVNDAAAYIRGLAQLRGRNVEWAERAVREAVSLAAHEAAAQKVIDLQARDLPDLLRQLDGRSLRVGERALPWLPPAPRSSARHRTGARGCWRCSPIPAWR